MNKRTFGVVVMVVATMVLSSGCSWTQVQTWFAVRGIPTTENEARTVADIVNKDEPKTCDANYTGGCVPTNITSAYCVGTMARDGFAITVPLRVVGWDHLNLDPDRDGRACPGSVPIGNLESVISYADRWIVVEGWATDRDAKGPIEVQISLNGRTHKVLANQPRSDVAAAGHPLKSGFTFERELADGVYEICVTALNVGGGGAHTKLGCTERIVGGANTFWLQLNQARMFEGRMPLDECPVLDTENFWMLAFSAWDGSDAHEARTAQAATKSYGTPVTVRYFTNKLFADDMFEWLARHDPDVLDELRYGDYEHASIETLYYGGTMYWGLMWGSGGNC